MSYWRAAKASKFEEGLLALPGERNPYPVTSFAGLHWRRGQAAQADGGNDGTEC